MKKNMKKIILFLLFTWLTFSLFGQKKEFYGSQAAALIKGAEYIVTDHDQKLPYYVRFRSNSYFPVENLNLWLKGFYKSDPHIGFKLLSSEEDKLGWTHYRYQQTFDGTPIEFAVYLVHARNGYVVSVNGDAYSSVPVSGEFSISSESALSQAIAYVGAEKYKWEIPEEEAFIKKESNQADATFFPVAQKVYFFEKQSGRVVFRPAYKFDIYAAMPVSRAYIYVDASSGKILLENKRIHTANAAGTAHTRYSGVQPITTDSYNGSYRLRETGRGNGIQTFDMNLGSSYNSAVDFTDADNDWNNFNTDYDEVATDAHWATENTYDFYFTNFNRNSIDNNGFALKSYVHADLVAFGLGSNVNAFWDGQRMTYGDGNGSNYFPLTTVDICAHEITHGLTENTANLIYQDESGALNEGFSDIFGTAIEFFAKPLAANWTMGEDCGPSLRNIGNPGATDNPDTYQGTDWDFNQEVHQNSTVMSYWFYLLTLGGNGTNDIGHAYSVSGIGITKAAAIAYRTLTVYLIPSSDYMDARYYTILAAVDLYGACTPEVDATTSAWYAVGLGNPYVPEVVADFGVDRNSFCAAPFTVSFQNQSINASDFFWTFGDGATSTDIHPSHTYNNYGTFTVILYAYGGACGSDTMIKTNYINIDSNIQCVVYMPASGTGQTQTSCEGTLYDTGGPGNNYPDMTDVSLTIAPTGASQVSVHFNYLDVEPGDNGISCNYDYIALYDGPSVTSPLIGKYCNTTGSPGTVTSTSGAITIRQYSDQALNKTGFEMTWQCVRPTEPPDTRFTADYLTTCSGNVRFSDQSTNLPTSWLWDFGDGNTSIQKNPLHTYLTDGSYTVKLISTNQFGPDSLEKTDYITVELLDVPDVSSDTICPGSAAQIYASASGRINWYDSLSGGSIIGSGDTLVTTVLQNTTIFYAENAAPIPPRFAGKPDNSGAGGYYNNPNYTHYLIFDCFRPVVLSSVKVYANGPGIRNIVLSNLNEDILAIKKVWVPNGESRVDLNFELPPANNYRLVCDSVANLFRNGSSGSAQLPYPYLLDSTLSIKGNSADNPAYYYYFYDWEITDAACVSRRIPVTATVEGCVGIQEKEVNSFILYPNPANEEFYIAFSNPVGTNLKIELSDISGRKLTSLYYGENEHDRQQFRFSTDGIPAGIYLITVSNGEYRMVRKLTVL